MVCAGGWDLAVRWPSVDGVLNESLPAIAGLLQGVEIECDEVIEEETLDLATKDVDFGSDDVKGMAITARRARTSGSGSRPLFGG